MLGATPAPPLLFTALSSYAIGTGILSTPCSASPLPDPFQPLHFCCSSIDLPLVLMPEPQQEVSAGWPRYKSAPYGQGDLGTAVTSAHHVLQDPLPPTLVLGCFPGMEALPPSHPTRLPGDLAVPPASPQVMRSRVSQGGDKGLCCREKLHGSPG